MNPYQISTNSRVIEFIIARRYCHQKLLIVSRTLVNKHLQTSNLFSISSNRWKILHLCQSNTKNILEDILRQNSPSNKNINLSQVSYDKEEKFSEVIKQIVWKTLCKCRRIASPCWPINA